MVNLLFKVYNCIVRHITKLFITDSIACREPLNGVDVHNCGLGLSADLRDQVIVDVTIQFLHWESSLIPSVLFSEPCVGLLF